MPMPILNSFSILGIERENIDWINTKHMLTVIVCLMMLIIIILLNICILKYPGSCFRKTRDNSQIEMSDSVPPRIYCTQPIIRNDKMKRSSRDRSLYGLDHCTSDLPFLQRNCSKLLLRDNFFICIFCMNVL